MKLIPRRKPYFDPKALTKAINLIKSKGRIIPKLQQKLEKDIGIDNVLCVASGRAGLFLILKHSGLKRGSEILVPGYTFGTLTQFIKKAGFKPVIIDIDPQTFQMDPKIIAKKIGDKTSAILATHMFGSPCNIVEIQKIAKNNNLLLIEDCAEALGSTVNGRAVGTFGDISISSFDIAKPLQGIRGGIVFGKNKNILLKVQDFLSSQKDGGLPIKETFRAMLGYIVSQTFLWPFITYLLSFDLFRTLFVRMYRNTDKSKNINFNLNKYLALLTYINSDGYSKRIIKRQKINDLYKKELKGYINFQENYPRSRSNGYMVVGTSKADIFKLRKYLAIRGIDIAIRNEVADNLMPIKKSITSYVYEGAVALPIYETLTREDIFYISKSVKDFLLC